MERRNLGLTGIQLPVIGVGARTPFDVFGKESQAARRSLVDEALAESVNFFETSPDAGEADGILASSLTGRRQRAIVAATFKPGDSRLVHARIDRSLRLFDERLDIAMVEGVSAWRAFEPIFRQMKSDRSVRAAGVSCSEPEEFEALAELIRINAVDVVQIPYNPASPDAARAILPLASSVGVGVIVGQPFEGGELLSVDSPGRMLAGLSGRRVGSLPQAILRWIISDQRVCSVVVGTRRQQHLLDNLAAGSPPWLDHRERATISEHYLLHPLDTRYR